MKKEFYLFFAALLLSCILHLFIVLNIYHPGSMVTMPLTIGMVFGWLYTSATVKDYITDNKSNFKSVLQKVPQIFKYILGFSLLYSVSNFLYSLSLQQGEGWIDFGLDHNKLRGISAFWVLFYMFGLTGAYLKNYIFNSLDNNN